MIRNALFYIALACFVFACHKSDELSAVPETDIFEKRSLPDNRPDYGDSIFYVQWRGPQNDYTIKPKKINDTGFFVARPQGLIIDRATGEINVSKSETGIRYLVGFVKANTTDTAFTTIIIGGITYLDGIYSIASGDTLAKPFYNANPSQAPVCDASDDTDYPGNGNGGSGRCEFDDDEDLDSPNGKNDEPPAGQSANARNLRVRTQSGVINLKKSLDDGLFGPNPQNGDTRMVTIYYRLNDKSNKVLQSITVQLSYYEKKSDVPVVQQTTMTAMYDAFMQYYVVGGKPRPPQIVITRYSW